MKYRNIIGLMVLVIGSGLMMSAFTPAYGASSCGELACHAKENKACKCVSVLCPPDVSTLWCSSCYCYDPGESSSNQLLKEPVDDSLDRGRLSRKWDTASGQKAKSTQLVPDSSTLPRNLEFFKIDEDTHPKILEAVRNQQEARTAATEPVTHCTEDDTTCGVGDNALGMSTECHSNTFGGKTCMTCISLADKKYCAITRVEKEEDDEAEEE